MAARDTGAVARLPSQQPADLVHADGVPGPVQVWPVLCCAEGPRSTPGLSLTAGFGSSGSKVDCCAQPVAVWAGLPLLQRMHAVAQHAGSDARDPRCACLSRLQKIVTRTACEKYQQLSCASAECLCPQH